MKRHLFFLLFIFSFLGYGQKLPPFYTEVDSIVKKYDSIWDSSRETVVFTGSSSIRLWKNLESLFPKYQIINSGFGGSKASDLLRYTNDLILKYKPVKVFIYEGDNDIAAAEKPKEIMSTTGEIISLIKQANPKVDIILIAAKPSIARWHLKSRYKQLNRNFRRLAKKDSQLDFADVWNPMLYKRKLKKDIFIEDGLHMNSLGYDIWYSVIKKYID